MKLSKIVISILIAGILIFADVRVATGFFQNTSATKAENGVEAKVKVKALTPVVPGREAKFVFELESAGKVNVVCFTLDFDPAVFTYVSSSLPSKPPSMANLAVNAEQTAKGKFGLLVDTIGPFDKGTSQVALVTFKVAAAAKPGNYQFSFSAQPTQQGVGTTEGKMLKAVYETASITVAKGKKAIVGRVLGSSREGQRHSKVLLRTPDGSTREYLTGSFGAFLFDDLPEGTYSIEIKNQKHSYAPQIVEVRDIFNEANFTVG